EFIFYLNSVNSALYSRDEVQNELLKMNHSHPGTTKFPEWSHHRYRHFLPERIGASDKATFEVNEKFNGISQEGKFLSSSSTLCALLCFLHQKSTTMVVDAYQALFPYQEFDSFICTPKMRNYLFKLKN